MQIESSSEELPPAQSLVQKLDFDKIKSHLVNANDREKSLLLQALRWRLTRLARVWFCFEKNFAYEVFLCYLNTNNLLNLVQKSINTKQMFYASQIFLVYE